MCLEASQARRGRTGTLWAKSQSDWGWGDRPWGLMMLSRGRAAFWEILARPLGRSLPQSFGLENSVTIPARLLSLTDAKGLVKREKGAQPRDGILRKYMYFLKCIFR